MHSELMIFVKEFSEEFSPENMIQYERISYATNKSFVLATVNEDLCSYISFTWENLKIRF